MGGSNAPIFSNDPSLFSTLRLLFSLFCFCFVRFCPLRPITIRSLSRSMQLLRRDNFIGRTTSVVLIDFSFGNKTLYTDLIYYRVVNSKYRDYLKVARRHGKGTKNVIVLCELVFHIEYFLAFLSISFGRRDRLEHRFTVKSRKVTASWISRRLPDGFADSVR